MSKICDAFSYYSLLEVQFPLIRLYFTMFKHISLSILYQGILVCIYGRSYNLVEKNHQLLQEVAAMIVLKILAAPVMVALSLLAAMVTFLFCVASAVCEMGCIVLTLLSLILFISGQTVGGIVFLVLAFLVSPFGVPAIAEWLVDKLHTAKFALRDFITG